MAWSKLNVTKEAVVATLQAKRRHTKSDAAASRVCTSADYGSTIILSREGAQAITLPANGAPAGAFIDFLVTGSDSCAPTISAATTDTLIAANDNAAKSVTYATGNRIGAYLRCISNGTYWIAMNLSGTQNDITVTA